MSAYQKKGLWFVRVSLPDGRSRVVSCGTSDKVTAKAVTRLVDTLKAKRRWDALSLIVEKAKGVTLPTLYDAHERGELEPFLARLNDKDLSALVTEWAESGANAKYVKQVRRMIPAGERFPVSSFTRKAVSTFLAGLTVSGSTKNRYRAALSVYARWLVEREVLDTNPVRDVRSAKENAPRDLWLTTEQAKAVCDAAPHPYRGLFAMLYGGGVEIGAALGVRERDLHGGQIHVRGSKTAWRNRVVVLPAWAWVRVVGPLEWNLPTAPLFPGITERKAWAVHHEAQKAVGLSGYTLHDARHSYAVNALRSGVRPQAVATQLGHKDTSLLLKNYGRYVPDSSDYATPDTTPHKVEREVTLAR